MVLVRVVGERCDLGFGDNACLFGKDIAEGASHCQPGVGLVEDPDAWRSQLLAGFGGCYRAGPVDGLDYQRLIVSVVYLALVVVHDSISFVGLLGFLVSRLC